MTTHVFIHVSALSRQRRKRLKEHAENIHHVHLQELPQLFPVCETHGEESRRNVSTLSRQESQDGSSDNPEDRQRPRPRPAASDPPGDSSESSTSSTETSASNRSRRSQPRRPPRRSRRTRSSILNKQLVSLIESNLPAMVNATQNVNKSQSSQND
jgi:hypothetical protein